MGELRRSIAVNTISNYLAVFARLAIGIFMTRILFLGLNREEFGFWSLLWSIFGYSLMLDFGFGITAQKYTAAARVTKDWEKFSRLISTIFFSYCIVGVVLFILVFLASPFVPKMFEFSKGYTAKYNLVFVIFGIGTAIAFPFGFFSEMIRGLEKIAFRNFVQVVSQILSFLFILFALKLGYGLPGLAVVSVLMNIASNLFMGLLCFRMIPELRIKLSLFSWSHIREVTSFSVFAYIIMFTNLIIFKTDQIVIGAVISVAAIAIYQVAAKLNDLFKMFTSQLQDTISPVAARLFASREEAKLRKIMLESNRIVTALATSIIICLALFIKPILQIWLDLNDAETISVAMILLLSQYWTVIIKSSSVKILLMSEKQRYLTILAVCECVLNLALSLILAKKLGVIGVALGTIIPNIIINGFIFLPYALKFAKVSFLEYLRKTFINAFVAGVVMALFIQSCMIYLYPSNIMLLAIQSAISFILFYMIFFLIDLSSEEKIMLKQLVRKLIKKG